MKKIQIKILNSLILSGLASGLTACATSQSPLKAAARSERTITFAKAIKNPDGYKGANVVWGGRITEVISDPNKGAELVVSEIPLYALGKSPVYGAKPQGSFIVRGSGSLDPATFRPGEVITLTGEIIGTAAPGSEGQPPCPEVQMESVRFWQLKARPDLSDSADRADDYLFDLTRPNGLPFGWEHYYVPKEVVNPNVRLARTQN